MKVMTANEAKTKFGEVLETCVREPVVVNRHGRPKAVVMSYEDYQHQQQQKLEALRAEIAKGDEAYAQGDYVTVDREGLKQLFEGVKKRGRERAGLK